jgi:phosphatidylinositol-3-phosphatase
MSESYAPTVEPLENRNYLSSHRHRAVALPRPDHVVIVVEENHSYDSLFGKPVQIPGAPMIPPPSIPFLKSLAAQGALFTNSFAVAHPSQPNYVALFSGSTQGVKDDGYVTPYKFAGPDLGGELISKGLTFGGYSEDLPKAGYTGDKSGDYRKKHNPWADFKDVPASASQPLSSFPSASRFNRLPTVSFVIPTDAHDMHSGDESTADSWLQSHLGAYAKWAQTHNSLLIVTWDEDDHSQGNQIPTLIVGRGVQSGQYAEKINHYNVLRTVEDMYGLGHAGASATANPITDVWKAA